MASTTFRDSMNALGWSRRDPDLPVSTSATTTPVLSRLQSLNPFGDRGYVRLPTQEEGPGAPLPAPTRREEEEGFFALSRWDRLMIFGACNLAAVICFVICFTLFFVLAAVPRKFAILYVHAYLSLLHPSVPRRVMPRHTARPWCAISLSNGVCTPGHRQHGRTAAPGPRMGHTLDEARASGRCRRSSRPSTACLDGRFQLALLPSKQATTAAAVADAVF
ncbi:protein transport protein sft2 [Xylographa soralifera]|nr:protein transport protein sft2 [Xylographa soralifera]